MMLQNTPNVPIPEAIAREMNLWDKGFGDCQKFMAWHKDLAEKHLAGLIGQYGIKVHNQYMDFDGWGDGVQFLHAIVETPSGKLLKLKWHDSNQGFMVQCDGGGWGFITETTIQ